jgi:hypothetical protein
MICNICFIEDDLLVLPVCNKCHNEQIEKWFIEYLNKKPTI